MKTKFQLSKIPIRYILLGGISLLFIVFFYIVFLFLSFYNFNQQTIHTYKTTHSIDYELIAINNKINSTFSQPYRYISPKEFSDIYISLNKLEQYLTEISKFKFIKNQQVLKNLIKNHKIFQDNIYKIHNLNEKIYNPTDGLLAIIDNLIFQIKNNPNFNQPPFSKYTQQIYKLIKTINTNGYNQNITPKIINVSKEIENINPISLEQKQIKNNLLALTDKIINSLSEYYISLDQYGQAFSSGLLKEIKPSKLQLYSKQLINLEEEIINKKLKNKQLFIFLLILILFAILITYVSLVYNFVYKNLREILSFLKKIEYGNLAKSNIIHFSQEFSQITITINRITSNLRYKNKILKSFAQGNFNIDIKPLSKEDELAYTIAELKNYWLKYEQNIQKTIDSEAKQKWITQTLANLSDVLRKHSTNLKDLLEFSLKELLKHLDAPMGAIYYQETEENDEPVYSLKIAYAYDKKKIPSIKYRLTEGFVGTVAADAKNIIISPVPDNYIFYETAFGYGKPNTIAWFPIKFESKIYGVLEVATNEQFEQHHIALIEKFTSDLASTINYVLINEQTKKLVDELTQKTEEFEQREIKYKLDLEEYKDKIDELNKQIKQLKVDLNIKQNIISDKVAKTLEIEQKLKEKENELNEALERFKKIEKAYETKIKNLEDQIQKLIDKYEK